jgi:Carboxypeptidase regulatory-like domain/TonB-dependent Receptor Plug Domain/TonB dependent receptor
MRRTVSRISALIVLFACGLRAQIAGDAKGLVADPSGGAVPRAQLTLSNSETGEVRKQLSDNAGRFTFDQLKIGRYNLAVEAAGFRQARTELRVRVGETTDITLRLEIGTVSETVEVRDAATQLNTTNSQMQTSVEGEMLAELPVRRDPIQLVLIAPGIAPVTANNPFLTEGSYNAHGSRGRANNITVDNITATDISITGVGGQQTSVLNFEQIKEVKLITNNFSAEYGRNAGSQLLLVTRDGGNRLHGALFEFLQNNEFNARDWFDRSGGPSVNRFNDFGYALGGPLRANQTHFFTTYENTQVRGLGGVRIAQVPTPAMVAALKDPLSRQLVESYKIPVDPSGQVAQSAPNQTRAFQFSFRADHQLTGRDNLTARYAHYQYEGVSPSLTFLSSNLAGFGSTSTNGPRNLNLAETHVFGTTVVNEVRFGYGRSSPAFAVQAAVLGPRIIISNGQVDQFGESNSMPQWRVQNTFQASDTLAWVKGAHNFKAGADLYRYQLNSRADASVRGTYTFGTWNDFAAGTPLSYTQNFGTSLRGYRVTNQAYFLQDDWRLTHRLTVNLGLRAEPSGSVNEVNHVLSNVDLDCREAVGAAGTGPLGCFTIGRPAYRAAVNWAPRLGFAWSPSPDHKTVIRGGFGIAYDFIYLNLITNQRGLPPFNSNAALSGITAFTGGNTFGNLANGTAPLIQQTLASIGKINPTALNFGAMNPGPIDTELRNPQVLQWNLGIEREWRDLVVKAFYVGTKGNYLQRTRFLNPIQGVVAASSLADESARMAGYNALMAASNGNASRPSNRYDPRFNDFRYVESSANSNYHAFELLAQKRFAHGYALQAAYTRSKSIDDISDALGVLINDSSAQQDPNNNRNNRGVSQFDLSQRLALAYVWELPFAKRLAHPVLRRVLAGWSLAGISSFRTGFPVTLTTGARLGMLSSSLTGQPSDIVRPNVTGSLRFEPKPAGSPGAPNGLNSDPVQKISAYAASLGMSQPLLGNLGGLGRNALRLNGERQFDWNIYKKTRITEKSTLELRAEFYNIFNNHAFQDVQRSISSAAFGQYTTTSQSARVVQLGARIEF